MSEVVNSVDNLSSASSNGFHVLMISAGILVTGESVALNSSCSGIRIPSVNRTLGKKDLQKKSQE